MLGSGLVEGLDRIDCSPGEPGEMCVTSETLQRTLFALYEERPASGYVAALVASRPGIVVNPMTLFGPLR